MMANTYPLGQTVTVSTTFANAAGAAANPTTVVLTVRSPSGDVTTPTPSNSGTGTYEAVLAPDEAGVWRYEWKGTTGSAVAVDQDWFTVERRLVGG